MTVFVECDWCGDDIDTDDGWATFELEGRYKRGRIDKEVRHYHSGWGDGDRGSCVVRALGMLDGVELEDPTDGFEWKLVPTGERHRGSRIVLGTTPLSVLGLKVSTQRTLESGGVLTVEHAADMRQRGETPRGLGAVRTLELDKALLDNGFLGRVDGAEAASGPVEVPA
jgi:hypothetical protein